MDNFFYRRLSFFNKEGNPLNFDYIGATGPAVLDRTFTYRSSSSVTSNGNINVNLFDDEPAQLTLYKSDQNGYDITEWANYVNSSLIEGAEIFLNGRIVGQQEFSGQILYIILSVDEINVNFVPGKVSGQRIISLDNTIYFSTSYSNLPGGYFKGSIYFNQVSAGLYENEQIFIIQNFYNRTIGGLEYGLPHTGVTGSSTPKWRTRWYNDNYGETDVSEIIFTYKIQDQLEGGDGNPLIISYPNIAIPVEANSGDTYFGFSYGGGYINTSTVTSESIAINVALNTTDVASNIYERKLIVEDISGGQEATPIKVLEIDFYGEVVGQDDRFDVLLNNIGRAFYQSDSVILRDHDPEEPFPNFLEINQKRKELLVAGEEIFPYIGSYKGLVNALKFFGYQDLRIKEYWLNLDYQKSQLPSPLQRNKVYLDELKVQQAQGYNQSFQVADVLSNENTGKYRLIQTYGPDGEGNYVLNVGAEDSLLPNIALKKTALFGLYYDLNKTTGNDSLYNYPEVVDAFSFTQEEVLLKIFALKERLKKDYLPLNARIIDITGEGIYFDVYNTRSWTDQMQRPDIDAGIYFDVKADPDYGFIEDLRNFSIRPLANSIQTPSEYYNSFHSNITIGGGTGSAIYFDGISATGPNPSISITAGEYYEFTIGTTGFDFWITADPLLSINTTILGLENNGVTAGYSLKWNVDPLQTTPLYYYSSQNSSLLNGEITVLSSTLSDFGNTINPLDAQQNFSALQNQSLIDSISSFYDLKQQGLIKELGDGKYDPPSYTDPVTGLPYKTPLGMPIILELILDRWTWDHLNLTWNSIIIPIFKKGDRVRVKNPDNFANGYYGTVTAVYYAEGTVDVLLDYFNVTQKYGESELFAPFQVYCILNWGNIDFSNMVEIEWIIDKSPTQTGSPYHFEFSGSIIDFYKLAHFVPYTGEYKITCNIIDGFNVRSTVIKNKAITVNPKRIEIDAWTRYREVEKYVYDEVYKPWDSYQSIWEYPAEGSTIQELEKTIPKEILDFSTYGNKSSDGQDGYVKIQTQPIGATGTIVFTQNTYQITDMTSYEILTGQYGFLTLTTSTAHNLITGEEATILGTIPEINGRWNVIVPFGSATTFQIPLVLQTIWNHIIIRSSPNRLYVDMSPAGFPNPYFTGAGTISVYAGGREMGVAETGDSLYRSANAIVSAINSLVTYPDYFASCEDTTADPVSILITAPSNLGADQNGVILSASLTGSLSLVSITSGLSGGVSSTETYEYWSPDSDKLPNDNLRYWGTKKLNWDVFTDNSWDNGYAHGWEDLNFNNDWLGGFELHNIQIGDNIKLSTGNQSYPFPIGVTMKAPGRVLSLSLVSRTFNWSPSSSYSVLGTETNGSGTGLTVAVKIVYIPLLGSGSMSVLGIVNPGTGYAIGDQISIHNTGKKHYGGYDTYTVSSLNYVTINDFADQLNSSTDPYITDFYYRVIPNESGDLPPLTGPINVDITNFGISASPYPAPFSVIGGSPLLIPSFGITGHFVTSTTTTTTIAPTTTTTTTLAPLTTTTTTTTSTTTTSTTTTSTTTTTTLAPITTTTTTTTLSPSSIYYLNTGTANTAIMGDLKQTSPYGYTISSSIGTKTSGSYTYITPTLGITSPSTFTLSVSYSGPVISQYYEVTSQPSGLVYTGVYSSGVVTFTGVNTVGQSRLYFAVYTTSGATTTTTTINPSSSLLTNQTSNGVIIAPYSIVNIAANPPIYPTASSIFPRTAYPPGPWTFNSPVSTNVTVQYKFIIYSYTNPSYSSSMRVRFSFSGSSTPGPYIAIPVPTGNPLEYIAEVYNKDIGASGVTIEYYD